MLASVSFKQESQESILFHPVLKAYQTCHSWIITAHVPLGETVEDVYPTESKIETTAKFSTMETTSSRLSTLSITDRLSILGQHLYISQITHLHSDPTIEERTFFQWHVTFQQMHQEKPLTLLRGCPQLAHLNSYDQRCKGHQEKSQPAYQNTDPRTGNIDTCHLNTKHHQICHTRQHINTVMETVERTHNGITTLFNINISIYTCINYLQIHLLYSG